MSAPAGLIAYRLSYQLSPIILTGGVANLTPAGMLPIISITEAVNFVDGLLGGADIDIDDFFANFTPLPGATVADNAIGNYPFANQSVAANAIIAQPLKISVRMDVPARDSYAAKTTALLTLWTSLNLHDQLGGTYTIITPANFWPNCIRTSTRDVSNQNSKQVQNAWQFDFVQPLITLAQAAQAQNAMMSQISNGLPSTGALSGTASTVGYVPTVVSGSVVPASSSITGTSIAGPGSYGPQGSINTLQ